MWPATSWPTTITRGVLAREEVVAYLNGSHGASGEQAEQRVHEYLDELRTRQRHAIYRVLKHPLYPIFRKIDRHPEHIERIASRPPRSTASSTSRTIAATSTT